MISGMKDKLQGMLEKVRKQPKKTKKSKYSSLLKFVFLQFTDFFKNFYKDYCLLTDRDIPNIQENLKEFTNCLNYELIEKVNGCDKKLIEIETLKEELESKKIKYFNIINSSNFKTLINMQNNIKNDHIRGIYFSLSNIV